MRMKPRNPEYITNVTPILCRAINMADALEEELGPSIAGNTASRAGMVYRSALAQVRGEPRPRGAWPSGNVGTIRSDGRLSAEDHYCIAEKMREIVAGLRNYGLGAEPLSVSLRLLMMLRADCSWHCGPGVADAAYTDLA